MRLTMQAIRTRYFGPTNSRGARIQAKVEAGAIFVPFNHELTLEENHQAACRAMLVRMNWNTLPYSAMVGASFNGDLYWVFADDLSTRVEVAS